MMASAAEVSLMASAASSFTYSFLLQAVLLAVQVMVDHGTRDANGRVISFLQLALAELQNP
jgi:hypothetical protein